MHTDAALGEIEVIELTLPAEPLDADGALHPMADVQQWAAHVFRAGRVQPARAVTALPQSGPQASGAGGARAFYWWMLVAALLAVALA